MAGLRPAPDLPRVERVVDVATARAFVDTHLLGAAGDFDRLGLIPDDFLRLLSDAGLWAPFLPAGVGGSGLSYSTFGRLHEEFGRGCSSVRSLLTVHAMVAWTVNRWGTATQLERWLAPLAKGRVRGAFCVTEPEVGSDARAVTTAARRTRAGWTISGTKSWITGGQCAGVFLVFARTDRGLAVFLVPRAAPGVSVTPIEDPLGVRASMLASLHLNDAVLGPDALVGSEGFVADMILTGALDIGRYSVAAGSVGIVQACLEASADYTARRMLRDRPLRELPLIRAKISDMVTDAAAGRLLYERAGRLKDEGDAETVMATWVAKYFAAAAAARHAAQAVQIHGANGCSADYPVARLYRDAKVMEIIEGSTEIQQLTIADAAYRRATGSDAAMPAAPLRRKGSDDNG